MTLEEHRNRLLQRLGECAGAPSARELIGEAQLMLVCCGLQPATLRQFWEELRAALDLLQEDLIYVTDRDTRALRSSVIAAARVAATGLVNQFEETSQHGRGDAGADSR